jgi:hypothetical protein
MASGWRFNRRGRPGRAARGAHKAIDPAAEVRHRFQPRL